MVKTMLIENLGVVPKGREKRIVIRLMEIEGKGIRYVDVRTYRLVNGAWRATYKGITLSKYSFDKFLTLLNQYSDFILEALDPMSPEEFEKKMRVKRGGG